MTDHDFDLLTIGAGSGGVAATRRAGAHGARAAICEEDRAGGTCVLRGCIPKKLLVYAAHVSGEIEDAANYGWSIPETRFDWPTLIANKNTELARLNGIYNKMLADAGVELVPGRGRLIDAHTVEIETASGPRRATAETILIATGGWPSRPAIPGIEHAITSTEALDLATFPERVVVGGGGYIAVEFCGIFRHLGAQVTEIIRADHILRGFDEDVREHLEAEMRGQGIDIRAGCTIDGIRPDRNGLVVTCSDGTDIPADAVLCAMGRVPNTSGIGLEEAGVELRPNGAVMVDEWSRTTVPNIYAVGDCTDRVNLTPVAITEGRALVETLYNDNPRTVDYADIPSAVFSQPPIGTVGLTEAAARERYGEVAVYRSAFRPLKATLSGNQGRTMMKLIVDADTDRVVGCHMVGDDAAEIIQGVAIALKCDATKAQFDATIGIHPTAAEEFVTMYQALEAAE